MTTKQWMDIIYPLDAALFVGLLVVKLSYRFIVRSSTTVLQIRSIVLIRWIIGFDCLLIITELSVLILLGLSTGADPPFTIDQYRVYVVIARALMGVALACCISVHLVALYEYVRDHNDQAEL